MTKGTTIIITKAAHDAIRAASLGTFEDSSLTLPDGRLEVPVQVATRDRIQESCLDGETISDCIVRMFALQQNGGRLN